MSDKSGDTPHSSPVDSATDNDLVQEILHRNIDALGTIVDRYQHLVYRIAFRVIRDEGEAEDVVQEIFLLIFRKAKLFDPSRGIFKVWLLRCAYTMSMKRRDMLQRRRFYLNLDLEEAGQLAEPGWQRFAGTLTQQEAVRYMDEALDLLPINQREAINLIALEGMTLSEAAVSRGWSLSAAKNYYYRGVKALQAFNCCSRSSVGEYVSTPTVTHRAPEVGSAKPQPA